MRGFLSWLQDTIWPRKWGCMFCGALVHGEYLCPVCREMLESGLLTDKDTGRENIRSVFWYKGNAKQLVHMLKYDCIEDAAKVMAQYMAETVRGMRLPENVVLTWVTMPEVRQRVRGIDHGRELCQAIAAETGLPMRQLLSRAGNCRTQRGLNREMRQNNAAKSIRCNEKIDVPVLLVDDVLTTGATISASAIALIQAGAPEVFAITATKVLRKNRGYWNLKGIKLWITRFVNGCACHASMVRLPRQQSQHRQQKAVRTKK